jgi:hypothetical protein
MSRAAAAITTPVTNAAKQPGQPRLVPVDKNVLRELQSTRMFCASSSHGRTAEPSTCRAGKANFIQSSPVKVSFQPAHYGDPGHASRESTERADQTVRAAAARGTNAAWGGRAPEQYREQLWRRCCRGRANGALNDNAPPLEAVALANCP